MDVIPVFILVPPDTLLIDIAGPLEVLRYANQEQDRVRFDYRYISAAPRQQTSIGLMLDGLEPLPDSLPDRLKELIVQFPAGSLQFEVGIQSFKPEVQQRISRKQDNTKTADNLRWLVTQSQAHVHADLIFGLPGETLETIEETTRYAMELNPHTIQVSLAAPYPGTVVPIQLAEHGGTLICQKDAFLCAAYGTAVGISFNKRLGAGFFGGEGFILQKLEGDGLAFVHAGGTVIRKELNNETLRLDTGCLVAFTSGIDYDIALAGGLKSMLFGGEGILLATLKGTGTVWVQSLPFSRLAERIYEATFKAREEVRAGGK